MTINLTDRLLRVSDQDGLRKLKTVYAQSRPVIQLHDHRAETVIDFCSNDYLGLSRHPALVQAAIQAVDRYGTGSTGSRLIGGTLNVHAELEAQLCQFKGTPAALVFNSGYQANLGVLSGLIGRHDIIFADKLNHASLIDGAILSRAQLVRYPHLDMNALENHLAKASAQSTKWIVTDTVFSMDGDLAPLKMLYALAERYGAWLVLDEAHATGLFGAQHRSGLWETTGIGHQPRVIQMGTFSKALGSFGAYVAASKAVIQNLIQFSRSFIYSTALPPAVIAANLAAIKLVSENGQFTQALADNLMRFQGKATAFETMLSPVQSPIIPITLGDNATALSLANDLLHAGYFVQAIRPPAVPQGSSRLRITLSAAHTGQQIDGLCAALAELLTAVPAPAG